MNKLYILLLCCLPMATGLAQTTTLLNNIPDPGGAGIGNRVVFVNFATGEIGGTDGTVAGTVTVPASTVVLTSQNAARLGNKIVFVGFTAATGNELWISDGTVAGTTMLKDIHPTGSSNPQGGLESFTVVGNTIYFTADDGTNGRELWKTDGTTAGTVMVKDLNASVINFVSAVGSEFIGNTLFFTANVGADGLELWKTDGTSAGTVMVKNITAGLASTTFSKYFVGNGTYVWFVANDGVNGLELWRTDGTTAGTFMLQNIGGSDGFSLFAGGTSDWNGVVFNGDLYFNPNGPGVSGNQLWKSNGSSAGTTLVTTISGGGSGISLWESVFLGSKFYFPASGSSGYELYSSDGTAAGTTMVKDINPTGSSDPRLLVHRENLGDTRDRRPLRGKVMFLANDGTNGVELWASDGTESGTVMLKNINAAGSAFITSGFDLHFFTHYKLFFVANNGTNGDELWETDGTTAGTVMVQDIWPGAGSSSPEIYGVAEATNILVFQANNGDGKDMYALNATVTPFPLILTDFSAEKKGQQVELNWQAEREQDFSHFLLQRSISGTQFTTIAKLNGNGVAGTHHYVYRDQPGNAGSYFYRLEMVDKDGQRRLGPVEMVKMNPAFSISLSATRHTAMVNITGADGIVHLRLIDAMGRLHLQRKEAVQTGTTISIATGHLPAGIYVVVVESEGAILAKQFLK